MFLSSLYSFQFKGNIPEPFRAIAVTAVHNEPVNGLRLLCVTVLEPNKTVMKSTENCLSKEELNIK